MTLGNIGPETRELGSSGQVGEDWWSRGCKFKSYYGY